MKLAQIQTSFHSKKSRTNKFGGYKFRSAEDILEGLKPFIAQHGVIITVSEQLIAEGVIESTATISDGKDSISATAIVGVDFNQKGMQMPQKYGSASSYGKKYALGNLLLIDDTADADASNTHGKSASKPPINADNFDRACKFLSEGGQLSVLQQKYTISSEMLAKLKECQK